MKSLPFFTSATPGQKLRGKEILSYPTAKQQTPRLMGRSGHEPVKGWVL